MYVLVFFWIVFLLLIATYIPLLQRVTNRFDGYIPPIRAQRWYLLSLLLIIATAIIYWAIDTHIVSLPHPIVPFILYVIVFSVIYGFRGAFFLFVISAWLTIDLLYRHQQPWTLEHALSLGLTVVALIAGLVIGAILHRYQRTLMLRIETLRHGVLLRDQFASETAHELKTPLTAIKLYTDVILRKTKDKTITDDLRKISNEADRLAVLINGLLDYSRLHTGKLQLKKERHDLALMCRDLVETMQTIQPTHQFVIKNLPKSATIFADKTRIAQVITNLFTNATRYAPENTKITLDVQKKGNNYLIMVQDQGPGILAENRERIFEPFFQVEGKQKVAKSKEGLGLGLYIAKEIVALHGGNIRVQSSPGQGALFIVSLPDVSSRATH